MDACDTGRVAVGQALFDNVSMEEAVAQIVQMACRTDRARHVCTGNLDHLVKLERDSSFQAAYAAADLVLADGAPVVWLSRLARGEAPLRERVTGSDLVWELASASEATGLRLFLLGGAPGAAEGAAEALRRRFPEAQICGVYCPPADVFETPAEQARIREAIQQAQPDILLVGLGAPKQEKWILANKEGLGVPVAIGVGGAFEMKAGVVRRAPGWMRQTGLEWAYRLGQEPGRLWRRYLLQDLPFLLVLSLRVFTSRRARQRRDAWRRSQAAAEQETSGSFRQALDDI